jgi:hypothetical protein
MSKPTGDDENSLIRILETIRIASILILLLHFYLQTHRPGDPSTLDPAVFDASRPPADPANPLGPVVDRLTTAVSNLPIIGNPFAAKSLALLLLGISLLGANGKKSPNHTVKQGLTLTTTGVLLYFTAALFTGILYIAITSAGWLLILHSGNYLSRIIWHKLEPDIFNRLHESFPQEQRLLQNPLSVNIPAHYQYHGATLESWLNFVSPQRGTILLGSPGAGKTAAVLIPWIKQVIKKNHALVLHDFKYDDLSRLAYNEYLKYEKFYAGFYVIQFDDLVHSHRCNLLHPSSLADINEAEEAARALLLGLNMDWISKQGDFFVDSAISLVKALIWFLWLYENGKFCSWPHVIELAQIPKKQLFSILRAQPQIQALVTPFVEAITESAGDQIAGQLATPVLGLAKLASPKLYYILTGNDLTLDVNDPEAPKIIVLGNNPQKATTYGPLVSAYLNAINRLANRRGAHPLAEVFEEFSTISVHTIDKTIATGRSNNIAVILCLQNINQLKQTYGDKLADTIFNTCGNIISGQVTGETARLLSDRFGRTLQHRQSLTNTESNIQVTDSHQLQPVIPESRIATLSPGEFCGIIADTPMQPIELKTFCCRISVDFSALNAEEAAWKPLPVIQKDITDAVLDATFLQVRTDIHELVNSEMKRISDSVELCHLIIS